MWRIPSAAWVCSGEIFLASTSMPMPAATGTSFPSTNTTNLACLWKASCSLSSGGRPAARMRFTPWSGAGHGAGAVLGAGTDSVAAGAASSLPPPPPQPTSATATRRVAAAISRRRTGPRLGIAGADRGDALEQAGLAAGGLVLVDGALGCRLVETLHRRLQRVGAVVGPALRGADGDLDAGLDLGAGRLVADAAHLVLPVPLDLALDV